MGAFLHKLSKMPPKSFRSQSCSIIVIIIVIIVVIIIVVIIIIRNNIHGIYYFFTLALPLVHVQVTRTVPVFSA